MAFSNLSNSRLATNTLSFALTLALFLAVSVSGVAVASTSKILNADSSGASVGNVTEIEHKNPGSEPDRLVIRYSESMDVSTTGNWDLDTYFTLSVIRDGQTINLKLGNVSDADGQIQHFSPITDQSGDDFNVRASDTVELTYTGGLLTTTSGSTAVQAGTFNVLNPDVEGPTIASSSVVEADGETVKVVFNDTLDTDSVAPTTSMFEVRTGASYAFGNRELSISSIDPFSSTTQQLILNLGQQVPQGDVVTVTLTSGTLTDVDGNSVGALSEIFQYRHVQITNNAVASPPSILSAELGTLGQVITLVFNETMTTEASPTGLGVAINGDSVASSDLNFGSLTSNTMTITLPEETNSAAELTISYDQASGNLLDTAGTELSVTPDFSVDNQSGIAPPADSSAPPPPYTGPLISGISEGSGATFNSSGTDTVTFEGERLGTVTKAFINGIEAEVLSTSNDEFEVSIPEGLEPGTYDLEITSSAGNLNYLDAITIVGTTSVETTSYGEVTAWTSRISDTQVKVYVKFPTVGEKARISHQTGGSGSYESVYVKTTSSETMEGLRIVEGVGTYVVRTIDLSEINRIRVTVGDEELVQVRYNQ